MKKDIKVLKLIGILNANLVSVLCFFLSGEAIFLFFGLLICVMGVLATIDLMKYSHENND